MVMPMIEERARPVRDALPEHLEWRDDGCEVAPHCLTCPLPRCRFDEPGGLRTMLSAARNQEVIDARRGGMAISAISGQFGISRRSVFRILQQANGRAR